MIPRRLKELWQINEKPVLLFVSFAALFVLGFLAGHIDSFTSTVPEIRIEKSQDNFSILKSGGESAEEQGRAPVSGVVSKEGATGSCLVKGSASSKIYHVPGGSSYDRLQNPTCFSSEAEAEKAGYRKTKR